MRNKQWNETSCKIKKHYMLALIEWLKKKSRISYKSAFSPYMGKNRLLQRYKFLLIWIKLNRVGDSRIFNVVDLYLI